MNARNVHGAAGVRTAFHNDPTVHSIDAAGPDDLEVLAFLCVDICDPAAIGRASSRPRRAAKKLLWLSAGLPPDNVVLDRVQLGKGAFDAFTPSQGRNRYLPTGTPSA